MTHPKLLTAAVLALTTATATPALANHHRNREQSSDPAQRAADEYDLAHTDIGASRAHYQACVAALTELASTTPLASAVVPTKWDHDLPGDKALQACRNGSGEFERKTVQPSLLASTTPDGQPTTAFACGDHIYLQLGSSKQDPLKLKLSYAFDDDSEFLESGYEVHDANGKRSIYLSPDPALVKPSFDESVWELDDRLTQRPPGRHVLKVRLESPYTDVKSMHTELTVDTSCGVEGYRAAFETMRRARIKTIPWPKGRTDLGKWQGMISLPAPWHMGDVRPVKTTMLDQAVATSDNGTPVRRQTTFVVGYVRDSDHRCFGIQGQLVEEWNRLDRLYERATTVVNPGEKTEIDCKLLVTAGR